MPLILGTNSVKDTGFDVANSCRFDGSSSSMKITPASNANLLLQTWSGWIKRGGLGSLQSIFASDNTTGSHAELGFDTNDKLNFRNKSGNADKGTKITTRVFRDPSAWYHIVWAWDSANGTAANRLKIYVNGVQETVFDTSTDPDADEASQLAEADVSTLIGTFVGEDSRFFNGYLAEVVFIDGAALAPTSFGEFDSDSPNIWKPKDVSGLTFGTHGFYLDFEADGTSTAFVDSGPDARAVSVTGGVDHSFTQAKFGGSSIFFDGTGDSLDIADSTDFDFGTGNFTFEFWVYKTASGKAAIFETRASDDNDGFNLEFNSTGNGAFEWYDTSIASGNDLPKDGSAISLNTWTHFAVVRNGSSCKMYRDGTAVGTEKDVGTDSQVSAGTPTIGESAAGANDFQGFLDEIRLSSTARYTGNFTAPSAAFTSDSDTVLLIQSKASNLISADVSGRGNHLTSSGLTLIDQTTDTCTNNFATLNGLDFYHNSTANTQSTLSEGNLKFVIASGNKGFARSTFGVSAGKWYFEAEANAVGKGFYGVCHEGIMVDGTALQTSAVYYYENVPDFRSGDEIVTDNAVSISAGDILGFALDMDNYALYISKNGTYMNSGNPGSGSSRTGAISEEFTNGRAVLSNFGPIFANVSNTSTTGGLDTLLNFGSPPYSESGGNADGNGFGNFKTAPPSGYLAFCTKNLAETGG